MNTGFSKAAESRAEFLVERISGTGYRVTHSKGRDAEKLKGNAISVLEGLGQLDTKLDGGHIQLVEPAGQRGYLVAVVTSMSEAGVSRYQQFWFRVEEARRATRWSGLLLSFFAVGFAGGAVGYLYGQHRDDASPPPRTAVTPVDLDPVPRLPSPTAPTPSTFEKELREELAQEQTNKVLEKLVKFLNQKHPATGNYLFAADPSQPINPQTKSVKLLSLTGETPPMGTAESENFDNLEVRAFLDLLEKLSESEVQCNDIY